jgi:hypothetical protein
MPEIIPAISNKSLRVTVRPLVTIENLLAPAFFASKALLSTVSFLSKGYLSILALLFAD